MALLYLLKNVKQVSIIIIKFTISMYSLFLQILRLISFFLILFPNKHKHWFLAQKKILTTFKSNSRKVIWVHCSSLGEYENIKALIPLLKLINPIINVTFFSSSGYKHFNDFDIVTKISYLPIDIKRDMVKFIKLMNPMMVIISKNDIWPNMINILHKNNTPIYLVGCKLKKEKINNWLIGSYYTKYLSKFSHIFCEDKLTYEFVNSQHIPSSITKNTRIHQILIDSKNTFDNTILESFTKNKKTIIYGSIEKSDIKIIIDTINSRTDLNHIIVPHEINDKQIDTLKKIISKPQILYSNLTKENISKTNIIIIDVFGILKSLYQYSHIAYVGGGFNKGIHNTTEATIHGNMVLFGPQYKEFSEAIFFIKENIAFSIDNKEQFIAQLNSLSHRIESKHKIINATHKLLDTSNNNLNQIINVIKNNPKTK